MCFVLLSYLLIISLVYFMAVFNTDVECQVCVKFYVSKSLKNGSEVVIVYSVLPRRKVLNLPIEILLSWRKTSAVYRVCIKK